MDLEEEMKQDPFFSRARLSPTSLGLTTPLRARQQDLPNSIASQSSSQPWTSKPVIIDDDQGDEEQEVIDLSDSDSSVPLPLATPVPSRPTPYQLVHAAALPSPPVVAVKTPVQPARKIIATEAVPFGKIPAKIFAEAEVVPVEQQLSPLPPGFEVISSRKLRHLLFRYRPPHRSSPSFAVGVLFENGCSNFRADLGCNALAGLGFVFEQRLCYYSAREADFHDIVYDRLLIFRYSAYLSSLNVISYNAQPVLRNLFRHIYPRPTTTNLQDLKILAWLFESEPQSLPSYEFPELVFHFLSEPDVNGSPKALFGRDLLACKKLLPLLRAALDTVQCPVETIEREMTLIPVLALMESTGICCDSTLLNQHLSKVTAKLDWYTQEAQQLLQFPINLGSPKQVASALYKVLRLSPPEGVSKQRQNSTEEAILKVLASQHKLPQMVLDFRQLRNLKTNWIESLATKATRTGAERRVFANWHCVNTATGRLASSEPNLQAVPREEQHFEYRQDRWTLNIRDSFIASADCVLVAADYAQMELRILASLSQDKKLIAYFQSGEDFFRAVASDLNDKPPGLVTDNERQTAKRLIYALLYGMGNWSLAALLKCSEAEAEQFTANLFAKFEKLKAFIATTQENARIHAEIRTLSGRRRKLPGFTSPHLSEQARASRQSVNSVIQGSAADIVKTAMVEISRILLERPELGARLVLQIHDELVFEVQKECAEELRGLVKGVMEGAANLAVRLEVSLSQGERWGHLSHDESGKEEFELLVREGLSNKDQVH